MFIIKFRTSNAAFEGNYDQEVARILTEIANEIETFGPRHVAQPISDINGNTIGAWIEDGKQ